MSHHRLRSLGYDVPFSWEKEPGRSKVNPHREEKDKEKLQRAGEGKDSIKLPPPPCPTDSPRNSVHGLYIPLPPCPFQPHPQRSSSRKGIRMEDDPFLAAYKVCTKTDRQQGKAVVPKEKKKGGGFGLGRPESLWFSCKHGASEVIEHAVVIKPSHLSCLHLRER